MKIYTEITNKEIEEGLISDNLSMLWSIISSLEGDKIFQKKLEKIKWGINTKFDIRSICEEEYEKKVAFGIVTIERKNEIPITEFRDEKDERIKIMKEILRSQYDESFDDQKEIEIEGYDE